MKILGIDPATTCGWAVREPSGAYYSGVWHLKGGRFEGGGMRFLRLERQLSELLDLAAPDVVALEEVRMHKGVDAAHIYGGIIAVIAKVCEEREVPYFAIPFGTIKRCATGKGNANKEAMVAAAVARWPGWTPETDDEADARWICEAAVGELGG